MIFLSAFILKLLETVMVAFLLKNIMIHEGKFS
jgi:hypothetical protein